MDSVEHENDQAHERAHEIVTEARAAAVEDATFDLLMKKPRRESTFTVQIPNDDGTARPVRIRYRALSGKEYDDLVAAHPPTTKQKGDGATFNPDTFPPALIAAVSLVPKMTFEQARDLYHHPDWAAGEQRALYFEALDVCSSGLNVPFNAGD